MILLVIGLPGSGKTEFIKTLDDYIVHDDFISKFYNGDAIKDIKDSKDVCLIDPRLCLPDVYFRFINKLGNVNIVLFKNEPEKCIINKPHMEKTIKAYSKKYDLTIYKNIVEVRNVYSNSIQPE